MLSSFLLHASGIAIALTLGATTFLFSQPPEFNKCPPDYEQQPHQKQKAKKGISSPSTK